MLLFNLDKQSDGREDISVQRVMNDTVEFQRTEGFDDMSDIEQGSKHYIFLILMFDLENNI